ncbi:MAG: flagellar biosynthetic protein FliR [Alphaproteobacteria bacterium]|nr:flagellar biosynthetic protein FliR [Alphaproteobacteria bacterium]MDP6518189.1 flagellar biosynthetic protein FliR [Alphaproteobacteria bacterium]
MTAELFPFALVFIRLGAALMLVPAIGESAVPPRARLLFGLAFTVVTTPMVRADLPALPEAPLALALLIGGELAIGIFFGMTMRLVMSALHVGGMIFAFQSSLAAATMFDPNQAARSSLAGNFLNFLAIVFIFVTDLHHLMLRGMIDTYMLFPPGNPLPVADSVATIVRVVADAFRVGFQIATPIVVTGFLLYLGGGLLNRLMPQMMVFFVLLPIQITLGFTILMISLTAIMFWFASHMDETMVMFSGIR